MITETFGKIVCGLTRLLEAFSPVKLTQHFPKEHHTNSQTWWS